VVVVDREVVAPVGRLRHHLGAGALAEVEGALGRLDEAALEELELLRRIARGIGEDLDAEGDARLHRFFAS
jgi:hypothetical protein